MRPLPIAWGAVALAAVLLGGCRQAIGIDAYFNAPADGGAVAPADAGTSACGLPYGTTACAACATTKSTATPSSAAFHPTRISIASKGANCHSTSTRQTHGNQTVEVGARWVRTSQPEVRARRSARLGTIGPASAA
jgi:hypothetical protein